MMEKIDIVLVILNRELLERTLNSLNFDKVNLLGMVMDNDGEKTFPLGETEIPLKSYQAIKSFISQYKNCLFLISGYDKNIADLAKIKKFLVFNGLPEKDIVNFEISSRMSSTWLANLKHVKKYGADFFATGNEYMQGGLNLDFIPRVNSKKSDNRGGVILADEHQDLQQSYQIAQYVFKHVKPGTIKFVLIGLAPDSFHYDNAKDFSQYAKNFQYTLALNLPEKNPHDGLLKNLISDEIKNNFLATTDEQSDLNFDSVKEANDRKLSIKEIIGWENDSQTLTPALTETSIQVLKDFVEPCLKNIQILKDYIALCHKNGAKPIGVVFPFAEIAREHYNEEVLNFFRDTIHKLEEENNFVCIDWLDHLGYDCFYDPTHLNLRGTWLTSAVIAMKLNAESLIPTENFLNMGYDYFFNLSLTAGKKEYHNLIKRVFAKSVKVIRSKKKIKIGFVMRKADEWCGDDLYNLFAADKRFDVTIFLCGDNLQNVEEFKQRGLNVVAVNEEETAVPVQDIIISLTPCLHLLPEAFRLENLTPKTLIAQIPHETILALPGKGYYNLGVFRVVWKIFSASKVELEIYDKEVQKGVPRGIFSGYSRTDVFFKEDAQFSFDWKMTHPDAKKIIYAPHWSIDDATQQISFQWNCQFMYEFAKAHPEISWVVKPSQSFFATTKDATFSSSAEYDLYLQKWNELPNARVYAGGYCQDIFATSDGMIHDCGNLIAEYQYTRKPMIYLTRKGEKFNDIGKAILDTLYLVEEKDLDGIAEMIQKIFVDGKDDKAAERKKVFDKYLNYPKANGMPASEFIFKSITDELKPE